MGLVLGGTLTQLASWRWTLLINVPIALVAAVGAMRVVRESRAHVRTGYDIPGAVAVTVGLFFLVYGFTMAGTHGWGAPLTLGLLAGAAASVIAFVVIELRSPHPLLPMRVLLDSNRGGAFLASLLVGSALLGTFLFLTYFLQGTLGYSALKTGFAFLPFSGGIILGAGLASTLLPRDRAPTPDGDRAPPRRRWARPGSPGSVWTAAMWSMCCLPSCWSASGWASPSCPCPLRP